ncbi:MAG: hypothetical protein N3E37_01615 [Candidatus Micrarchaeota archaeon]|nr:hypothetical protein [Candidatus Micrarchaeota archaeon]
MAKKKRRGKEKLMICAACGRRVPRDKSVRYDRRVTYSTDLNSKDDIKSFHFIEAYYCISCAKAMRIFEKKKSKLMKQREEKV